MKFNWGTGISIVLALFILAIIAFYFYITNFDVHLVEENYYENELVYQQRIDHMKNTAALGEKINLVQSDGMLTLHFPSTIENKSPKGNITFYRPSDQEQDFTVPISLDDSLRQSFNISSLSKGKWMLKLDWTMDGKDYYFEETLIIH